MRLIDADALNNELIERQYSAQSMGVLHSGYPHMMAIVSKQPTVDAVPVVRCKDCCHAEVVRNKGVVMYIGCGYFPNNILSKDFYCANGGAKMDGERKEQ